MKKYVFFAIVLALAGCRSDAPEMEYYPDDYAQYDDVYVAANTSQMGPKWGANDDFAYVVPANRRVILSRLNRWPMNNMPMSCGTGPNPWTINRI